LAKSNQKKRINFLRIFEITFGSKQENAWHLGQGREFSMFLQSFEIVRISKQKPIDFSETKQIFVNMDDDPVARARAIAARLMGGVPAGRIVVFVAV